METGKFSSASLKCPFFGWFNVDQLNMFFVSFQIYFSDLVCGWSSSLEGKLLQSSSHSFASKRILHSVAFKMLTVL